MGHGLLYVSLEALQNSLYIPEGYTFVSADYDPHYRQIRVLVSSDKIPQVSEEYDRTPTVELRHKLEYYVSPDGTVNPEYRKITGSIKE